MKQNGCMRWKEISVLIESFDIKRPTAAVFSFWTWRRMYCTKNVDHQHWDKFQVFCVVLGVALASSPLLQCRSWIDNRYWIGGFYNVRVRMSSVGHYPGIDGTLERTYPTVRPLRWWKWGWNWLWNYWQHRVKDDEHLTSMECFW